MARLTISLLGPPRVEVDGEPIAVDTRKAIALLAYVAVTGKRQSRETLAALLWPEYDSERARAALRRTLSVLSKALGGQFLDIERTAVALESTGVSIDASEFREAIADGRDADAASLYRGDFLAGFGLRDSIEFDDWQFFEAETLKREYAGVLERLASTRAGEGRIDEAIDLARRWLALDPLQEPAHRLLMELYARSGQRSSALRQYRECARVLDAELGVTPLDQTTSLYEAIKEDLTPAPQPRGESVEGAAAPAVAAYPLVGRVAERRLLREALADADRGRLVVLEGEAGIGKTRLADELATRAQEEGLPVVRARCSEAESTLAYAVVADVLREGLATRAGRERLVELPEHWRGEATRLVPELGGAAASGEGPGARTRFIEGLGYAVAAAGRVVVVDDAHWIDEGSLEVLTYLARRLEEHRLCLVLTWRPEDVTTGHGLHRLLADARRGGRVTALLLSPLSAEEVAELAAAAGATDLAGRLYDETAGLPLFVVEYLAAALDTDAGEWPLPRNVADLLGARVKAAGETARQVLTAGAVLGRSFDLETVRDVSGRSEEEVVGALEELTRRRLVDELADGYDFGHERIRELVYGQTSLARRRLLHRRAAEALVVRERRAPGAQAALIADHFRLAGRDTEAADYYVTAGERARALYANADALGHFRSALALGHPEPGRLHEAIGDVLLLLADYDSALASFETAAATATPDRLAVLEHKLGSVYHRRGDWDLAAAHFEAALGGIDDPVERARLDVDRSLNEYRRGNPAAALALAGEALALAEKQDDGEARARAHNVLGVLASSRGESDEARRHLRQSVALAGALRDPAARVAALNNLALAERAAGNVDEALELTRQALELCSTQGDRHREAALHNNLADLHHAAGRDQEAMEHLKSAVRVLAEIGGRPDETPPGIWTLVEW